MSNKINEMSIFYIILFLIYFFLQKYEIYKNIHCYLFVCKKNKNISKLYKSDNI